MAAGGSKRVVYAALAADAAIAVAKLGVGLLTGSAAMLAEAAHSAADTVNQVFLLVGINLSDNPADEEHPFGYGKDRFFWAFLAAVFIFVAGGMFSFYEGAQKLLVEGEHRHTVFWPSYLVLGLAFLFDGSVLSFALREARRQAREAQMDLWAFLRESPDVTLKTALYEDSAAIIGLLLATGGLVLLQVTGDPMFDGISSILIGVVLFAVAIMLGRETRDLLLGASASPRTQQAIRAAIAEFPDITSVFNLLTMQLGLKSVLVTGEINICDDLTTDEIEGLLVRVAVRMRQLAPEVKNIYLEPHPVPRPGSARTAFGEGTHELALTAPMPGEAHRGADR